MNTYSAWTNMGWIALLCLTSCGCGGKNPPDSTVLAHPDNLPNMRPAPTVQLKIVDKAGFDAAVSALEGQVVLVDLWATWCEPCIERFPHIVDLQRHFEADGLELVTLSCDDPSDRDKVMQFLTEHGAELATNLLTSLDIEATFETYDIEGGVPFYLLYDRQGNLRFRFNISLDETESTRPASELEMRIGELLRELP